ncbi:hypothetical protein NLJ89_g9031 [Agrocybe chaxingu]|uniref:4-hydroxybenzoate polyprenyltransferase, mitochondrial n=1 Tax=Agrocybe chaxingu TaxID=84603 RepID=A0A9W8JTI1_9AGAR|nr:hypothetical protein NLJ89_g9031 [Agrocybe chaxingu]
MVGKSLSFTFNDVKSYLDLIRFDKPAGTLLVFVPHAFGLTMAARATRIPPQEYLYWVGAFFLWAFVARSLACTINDMCDHEYDRMVERTKGRPIASGKISLFAAGVFLLLQVALFVGLVWTRDSILFYYRLAWLPLIFIYPLMKRVTSFPQAWLGIAMNWGALLAWTAVYGPLESNVMAPLMGGLWAWTMFYDTIYACQDHKDDIKIGIGSSAIALQNTLKPFLFMLSLIFISLLSYALRASGHSIPLVVFTAVTAIGEMAWQIVNTNPAKPETCKRNLKRNADFGCVLWLGMAMDYIISAP